jgi:hypothetical protein
MSKRHHVVRYDAKGAQELLQHQALERLGVSISLKENRIALKGSCDPFTSRTNLLFKTPQG